MASCAARLRARHSYAGREFRHRHWSGSLPEGILPLRAGWRLDGVVNLERSCSGLNMDTLIIRFVLRSVDFETVGGSTVSVSQVFRYAQNPSETFDGAFTVCRKEDAKQFEDYRSAHEWLYRRGFMKRNSRSSTGFGLNRNKVLAPFSEWEIVPI